MKRGLFNVIWCESWDGQPAGITRDLGGPVSAGQVSALVRAGWYDATRYGWGVGLVVVTDCRGRRVETHRLIKHG